MYGCRRLIRTRLFLVAVGLLTVAACATDLLAEDPPALNPFGKSPATREDAIPGSCVLSDGRVLKGRVYLTRDQRLKIYDEKLERQREVPLDAVRKIECIVEKEWLEKEWRFKENANDEKFFTGRTYPARECHHTITLRDGRTISGPLSGLVYIQADDGARTERFLIHKRMKGELDTDLKSLVYLKTVTLDEPK